MITRLLFSLGFITATLLVSCAHPPVTPSVYHIGHTIPAGCRVEYFAQVHDNTWKPTLTQTALPRPMPVKEAEKWAISAAQQRLGGEWKDYMIRVLPSDNAPPGTPVVVWQRRQHFKS